jgi:hypothetical protein
MPPVTFVDQSGPTPGTALSAANINSLAAADTTEASTMDTLGGSSTWINNLNRLRNQLGIVIGNAGSSWNAAVQMIPLTQKNAASGVAALDAQKRRVDVSTGTAGVANGAAASPAGTVSIPTTGTGLGTGGSATLVAGSTDRQGQIHLSIGTSPVANNLILTVQYGAAYPTGSRVSLVPAWSGSGTNPSFYNPQQPLLVSASATGFSLYTAGAAMQASTTFWIDYIVNGY